MYRASLKEFQFLFQHQLQLQQLSQSARYADFSNDLAEAILGEAGRFAEQILDPINASGDREGAKWSESGVRTPKGFAAAYKQFAADGWTQLALDVEHGGQGAPLTVAIAAEEIWTGANMAFMLCPLLGRGSVEALIMAGSPEVKQRFLPRLVSGEWTGTMNLTEPQAGSDLATIRTRAQPEGDRYRLFGQKIFITYGDHDMADNIVHLVLARIDGAPAGTRGISLFVVPKFLIDEQGNPGQPNDVRCVSIEHKLGIHASPTCVMSFGDRDGAVGYLVGQPNRGLEYMFVMMNVARLSVGVQGVGVGERALQQATEWARTRIQSRPIATPASGPVAIIHHPDVRRMLLAMKSAVQAMRVLGLYAALQFDLVDAAADEAAGRPMHSRGELLIPIVKGWCTELVNEVTSLGVQIHGGMGYVEETGAAQAMRDIRIAAIYEGTTAIQANDLLGRKLVRDQGAALNALLDALSASLQSMQGAADVAGPIDAAVAALRELRATSVALMQLAMTNPADAYAVAVPFLMQCGFVLGGALLVESAAIATAQLASGGGDAEFLRAKQQTARFYVGHWLPQATALARVVADGGTSVTHSEAELI